MANPTVNELLEEIKIYLESQGGTYTPLADRPWPATVELENAIAQMLMQLIPSPSGGNVSMNNTLRIDAVFGNDSTGAFEDISKPFQTFAAALASLPTSGDLNFTIWVTNGEFNETVDFDAYLNTSAATIHIVYERGAKHISNNTASMFKCSSASKVIDLRVYNANISITHAQKCYTSGNSTNGFRMYNCTATSTGGAIFADANNNFEFFNTNVTSTGNFSNGANGTKIENCKITITAGGFGSVFGNFYLKDSIFITSSNCFSIRGITANNCIFKSTTSDCLSLSTASPVYLYCCTFVTTGAKYPIRTNGLTPSGAANNCSGITATLSDLPTLITDNYFQNTQNSY